MTPFDFINAITSDKKSWESLSETDQKSYSIWMINRILSMNIKMINIINNVQKYPLTSEQHYKLLSDLLPKEKIWNKYVKSSIKKKNIPNIEILANYFQCSQREIEEYIDLIPSKDIKSLVKQIEGK